MVDRTSNTIFYPSTDPIRIPFKTNASNADTFLVPHGVLEAVEGMNAEDDNDAIVSASVSGSEVTIGLVDDAGSNITADTDIVGTALIRSQ